MLESDGVHQDGEEAQPRTAADTADALEALMGQLTQLSTGLETAAEGQEAYAERCSSSSPENPQAWLPSGLLLRGYCTADMHTWTSTASCCESACRTWSFTFRQMAKKRQGPL